MSLLLNSFGKNLMCRSDSSSSPKETLSFYSLNYKKSQSYLLIEEGVILWVMKALWKLILKKGKVSYSFRILFARIDLPLRCVPEIVNTAILNVLIILWGWGLTFLSLFS